MSQPESAITEPCDVDLIDTSAASVPQLLVDVRANAIRAAIEAIRDTTSRAQAISLLEELLGGSQAPAPTAREESSRALKIADEAMFNVLSSNCVPGDQPDLFNSGEAIDTPADGADPLPTNSS